MNELVLAKLFFLLCTLQVFTKPGSSSSSAFPWQTYGQLRTDHYAVLLEWSNGNHYKVITGLQDSATSCSESEKKSSDPIPKKARKSTPPLLPVSPTAIKPFNVKRRSKMKVSFYCQYPP